MEELTVRGGASTPVVEVAISCLLIAASSIELCVLVWLVMQFRVI